MPDKAMTWRELRDYLNRIKNEGTLDCKVSICVFGDFYECDISEVEKGCPTLGDILEPGHPYIEVV